MTTQSESANASAESASSLNFPNYQPPQGIPNHGDKFAGPLNKLAMYRFRMLKGKGKGKSKKSDKVRVNYKKKPKFYY